MNAKFRFPFSICRVLQALGSCGVWLTILSSHGAVHAQGKAQLQPSAVNAASAATGNGLNKVAEAAALQGVLTCSARVSQVSNFLGFSPKAGALLMVPPGQPNQAVVSVAMEVPNPVGAAYASATFAPNQANGCGAAYDAVVYWSDTCATVAARQFPELKNIGTLRQNIAVLDGGVATKVFLMQAGAGCVSIKKEIVL